MGGATVEFSMQAGFVYWVGGLPALQLDRDSLSGAPLFSSLDGSLFVIAVETSRIFKILYFH